MKKRLFSIFLVLTMVLSLFPAMSITANAADDPELSVQGVKITKENQNDVLNNGKVSFDFKTSTLTLSDNTSLQYENGNCIDSKNLNLTIVVGKNCKITANDYAISAENGSLCIKGRDKTAGLTVESSRSAIVADGGLSITNCPTVNIKAATYGIWSENGDVLIDGCTDKLYIEAKWSGIYQLEKFINEKPDYDGSVTIKNCTKAEITAENDATIYAGGIRSKSDETYLSGGNIIIDKCKQVILNDDNHHAIVAVGGVSIKNCPKVDIITGKSGICSNYGDVVIDGCTDELDIDAKEGGILQFGTPNVAGRDYNGNITIKNCKKAEITAEDEPAIYSGGIWNADDSYLSGGCLTILNSALNANKSVYSCGDITIDGSKVNVETPARTALCAGNNNGYGTLTVRNNASVIAITNDAAAESVAVYSYNTINISGSEFFAAASNGCAIDCAKNNIKFNGSKVLGSTDAETYQNRTTLNKIAVIEQENTEYTAKIDGTVAKTVYVGAPCVYTKAAYQKYMKKQAAIKNIFKTTSLIKHNLNKFLFGITQLR